MHGKEKLRQRKLVNLFTKRLSILSRASMAPGRQSRPWGLGGRRAGAWGKSCRFRRRERFGRRSGRRRCGSKPRGKKRRDVRLGGNGRAQAGRLCSMRGGRRQAAWDARDGFGE